MGACEAVGGNMLTDAFGIVAMVAMTPLVTIQLLGLRDQLTPPCAQAAGSRVAPAQTELRGVLRLRGGGAREPRTRKG